MTVAEGRGATGAAADLGFAAFGFDPEVDIMRADPPRPLSLMCCGGVSGQLSVRVDANVGRPRTGFRLNESRREVNIDVRGRPTTLLCYARYPAFVNIARIW